MLSLFRSSLQKRLFQENDSHRSDGMVDLLRVSSELHRVNPKAEFRLVLFHRSGNPADVVYFGHGSPQLRRYLETATVPEGMQAEVITFGLNGLYTISRH